MKKTRIIMGMPITIEIVDPVSSKLFEEVFNYFKAVDRKYSTYKKDSEISKINRGLPKAKWSAEIKHILALCDQTKEQTRGYFNIKRDSKIDPSGLVKGWAINNATQIIKDHGIRNFYIDAGGDIQTYGTNSDGEAWRIGIRNPDNIQEIIKVIVSSGEGVATSGTYIRGQHIYDPVGEDREITEVKSLTVIGPDIYEADRMATAAFAMGKSGITFINNMPHLEGYMVTSDNKATYTAGFERYVAHA